MKGFTRKDMDELKRLSQEEMQHAAKHNIIVVLDDVRSMNNVGSAFRTCDAFLVEALYLCGYTPVPPHRDIAKTALGATETVSWKHYATTLAAVADLRERGYKIIAIEQAHNSLPLQDYNYDQTEKTALVFGNEVSGVSDEVLKMADACLEIPQWGSKHSLNIAVTVGVVLWEMVR